MPSTTPKPPLLTPKRRRPATRQEQACRALNAIAHGLHALDAGLLYGFTQEELAAYQSAWELSRGHQL